MRYIALMIVTATALSLSACGGDDAREPSGGYTGPGGFVLQVQSKSVELLAFDFPCRKTRGRTSLNGIALEKGSDGYEFSTTVRGIVSYKDGRADDNGVTSISGQFDSDGKSVRGDFKVNTKRCGATGETDWRASG